MDNGTTYVIVFLGLLIFFSHFFNAIFDRTRIPNAFLLMIIGIIVGPVCNLISSNHFGQLGGVFTTLTLIVIVFESGLSLRFGEVRRAIGSASILALANFILAMGVMSVLFFYLTDLKDQGSQGWVVALFLGSILGGTSSAVVIPMVRQLRLVEKGQSVLVLESALSDVLCLLVGLALLDSMKLWEVPLTPLFHKIWQSFLFAILLGAMAGLFWAFILNRVPKIKQSLFSTLAFAFVVYGIIELAGFNGGIATLVYGVILGNTEGIRSKKLFARIFISEDIVLYDNAKGFFSEIVFILQTYFFVYIGINIKLGHPSTYLIAMLVVVINILLRSATVRVLPQKNLSFRDKTIMSVLSPKGLVPAVLASLPLVMGISAGEMIQEMAYAVVFVSILTSSLLAMVLENNPLFFRQLFSKKRPDSEMEGVKVMDNPKNKDEIEVIITGGTPMSSTDDAGEYPEKQTQR